jgi:protein-arginine kinase activator protein McsA
MQKQQQMYLCNNCASQWHHHHPQQQQQQQVHTSYISRMGKVSLLEQYKPQQHQATKV